MKGEIFLFFVTFQILEIIRDTIIVRSAMAVHRVDGEGDTEGKGSAGGKRRRRFWCQL